jgi:sn-glycerol 3-phosphate transport system substrate-binding protein
MRTRTTPPHRSSRSRRFRRCAAVASASALLLAACGGSDEDGAPATTAEVADDSADDSADDTGLDAVDEAVDVPDAASDLAELCPVDALAATDGPVTVDLWWGLPRSEILEPMADLVDEYNASQDAVVVNLISQGTYNENLDKYLIGLRSGDRPTLIQLEETALQLGVDSGSFIPMQACVDAAGYSLDDYIDRTISAFTVEDVLWPMPFNISNPILYANMKALNDAGVTELPTTLAEMRAASQAVVDAGVAPAGISLTSSSWILEQLFALGNEDYADGGNGREQRATEVLIDNEIGLEIFTWLHDMVNDGLATYVGGGDDSEHFFALALGQAAMTMDTTAALRGVIDAAAGFPNVEVAVGPLPSVSGRDGGVLVGGAALWLDAETTDAERAAAWDFVTWLNSPEQQARWHAATGYVPIRTSAVELDDVVSLWADEPEFRIAYDQLVEGIESSATAGPVIGNHAQMRLDAIVPALEAMYLQAMPPQMALTQAKAQADAIIADYNRRTGN